MTSSLRRDGLFLAIAIAVVVLYIFLADQAWGVGFPSDDAWIHQTYGRNLAKHGEWSVVPGETSVASTSPPYTILIAVGHLVGLGPYIWTYAVGALTLALSGMLGAHIAREMFPALPYVDWAAGLFIVLSWQLIWTAGAGMETLFFAALCLALIRLNLFQMDPARSAETRAVIWRGAAFGALGGLLTVTRPEGMLLMGVLGLFDLWFVGRGDPRRYGLWLASLGVVWLIAVTPVAAFNYHVIGEVLPSTGSAKLAEYGDLRELFFLKRLAIMGFVLMAGAQLPAIFAIGRGAWIGGKAGQWIVVAPFVWALAHLLLYSLVLPLPNQNGRYVLPALPVLLIYAAAGHIDWLLRGRGSALGRVLSRVYALSVAGALVVFVWVGGTEAYAKQVRLYNTDMVETARWVEENIPDDELMAAHDIGALGYFAPRPILDLAGLISPEVVPIIVEPEALTELMCERDVKWLMGRPEQRFFALDDPRITPVYTSPYQYFDQAFPDEETGEPNINSVYAVDC